MAHGILETSSKNQKGGRRRMIASLKLQLLDVL